MTPRNSLARIKTLVEVIDDLQADSEEEEAGVACIMAMANSTATGKAGTIHQKAALHTKEEEMLAGMATTIRQHQPVSIVAKRATLPTDAMPTYLTRTQKTEALAFLESVRAFLPAGKPRKLYSTWLHSKATARQPQYFIELLQSSK